MDDEIEKTGIGPQKITIVNECDSENSSSSKLSHKQWRARLKRERRRLKRQETAKKSVADEGIENLKVEAVDEEFEKLKQQRDEAESAYLHAQWLEREKQALEQWQRTKERERIEKQKREEQEKRIKEEWEAQQKEEKEEQEKKDKIDKEKKSHQEDLLRQATANENKEGNDQPWHNPIVRVVQGKERDRCPFFAKTAACRFGDRCSRTHPETESSTTLLFRGMYSHFELEQGLSEEYDTDLILEYDDSELYQNFREFYEDIVPEFKAIGRLVQVKVCCNYEPHLRGNVYIQYRREDDAASAFMQFNGRFYGGKQLSCEYVTIQTWKSAICGLFGSGRCPKGRNCNFLHVFKNPGNEFWEADRSFDRYREGSTRGRNREWSQRSEGSLSRRQRRRSRSRERRRSRSRERRRSRSQERRRLRSQERRSKSLERRRSRSQERRSRSKSPSKRNRSPHHTRSNRSRSLSKDRHYRSNRKRSRNYRSRSRSRSKSKTKDRLKSKKKHSDSRSMSRGQSRSPKSNKKHSRSRSSSRSRSRSVSKLRYQHDDKQSDEKESCVFTDNIGESEKLLPTEKGENVQGSENNENGQVLETEAKCDLNENSNSSDSEKSTRSHRHKDKKHKHKKHKHKKHKKVILEWIEAP